MYAMTILKSTLKFYYEGKNLCETSWEDDMLVQLSENSYGREWDYLVNDQCMGFP